MRLTMSSYLRPLPFLSLLLGTINAFPSYDNPVLATPALVRPGQLLCQVDLITNAACEGYDQIITQPFPSLQEACGGGWVSKVVLDFYGSVKGIQFDRFGGLFLGEIELLRTTTPEPSPQGIAWHLEKDVSDYLSYFLDTVQHPKDAILSIPNVVDETYNGVIYVNATLSFYGRPPSDTAPTNSSSAANTSPSSLRGAGGRSTSSSSGGNSSTTSSLLLPEKGAYPPIILPLAAPSMDGIKRQQLKKGGGGNFWSSMAINGEECITVPLPEWPQTNIERVYLDLFASPHACEEFFYTNLPTDQVEKYNASCGGGTYRELQVWVDGRLAGATYPFIVLYTGGVNPFLWRPLSGIESFDIPAYRFDLTPFAGIFNSLDSSSSSSSSNSTRPEIVLKAYGNNAEGVWYLTSALLLYPDPNVDPSVVLSGAILSHADTDVQAHVHVNERADNGATFKTVGYHTYSLTGSLNYPNGGHSVVTSIASHLSSWNENTLRGENVQTSVGAMSDHTTIERHDQHGNRLGLLKRKNNYPYRIESSYTSDNQTMEIRANVDIALERSYEDHGGVSTSSSSSSSSSTTPQQIDAAAAAAAGAAGAVVQVPQKPFIASWSNQIKSNAVYNRSLDHKNNSRMFDESVETFQIVLGDILENEEAEEEAAAAANEEQRAGAEEIKKDKNACYHHRLKASGGKIEEDRSDYSCVFPQGVTFCGYHVCNALAYEIGTTGDFENVAHTTNGVGNSGGGSKANTTGAAEETISARTTALVYEPALSLKTLLKLQQMNGDGSASGETGDKGLISTSIKRTDYARRATK